MIKEFVRAYTVTTRGIADPLIKMRRSLPAVLVAQLTCLTVWAGENTLNRQSHNVGINALPARGKVVIDGDLSEWDWSQRIWVFPDWNLRERYSVELSAMWDANYLYLGAKWKDPLPLNSKIDPAINPDDGWRADAMQLRIKSDHPLWLTAWHYAPGKKSIIELAHWKDPKNPKAGLDVIRLSTDAGKVDLGRGAQLAYQPSLDGKGFSQEMRVPWSLLYRTPPAIRPGLTCRTGCEFIWGDSTGTGPALRYADNLQPGTTAREFFWSAVNSWGSLYLTDGSKRQSRRYEVSRETIAGTIPVRATIPRSTRKFTIVIDSTTGERIRTLAADRSPADFRVLENKSSDTQTVEVLWDCLDDMGNLVPPGTYQVRGLTHEGLTTKYEMCFYNPGTPPWRLPDGTGAWGADHTGPIGVTRAGDWTAVCFEYAEGGSGVIGIDPSGRKRWGNHRGARKLAGDDRFVYACVTRHTEKEVLCRFEAQTGKPAPFKRNGKPLAFDLSLEEILGEKQPGHLTGMAAHNGKIALAFSDGQLYVIDASSTAIISQLPIERPGDLAYSSDGTLYGAANGKLRVIDPGTHVIHEVPLSGVELIAGLAVDAAGNIVVADGGPDSQVKVFTRSGNLRYTCGARGGRPLTGDFNNEGMTAISSVAVDATGLIWVTEHWEYPRRVSVWGADGKLRRHYIGNAHYAGTGCFLHDQDPSLGYFGPVEMVLNKTTGEWKVAKVLWLPTEMIEGKRLGPPHGQRFRSAASGEVHEYMYLHDTDLERGNGHIVLMEENGKWRAVATIALAGHLSGKINRRTRLVEQEPSGELAGLNAYDVIVWNDTDKDGRLSRHECIVISSTKPQRKKQPPGPPLDLNNGWGGRIGDDLTIFTGGISIWRPTRFIGGAPVYGLEGMSRLTAPQAGNCDLVPITKENRLIFLGWSGKPKPRLSVLNLLNGKIEWSYPNPYPGVHGSHHAPMAEPGLLIGPLKTCGVAHVNDRVGNVFLLRGNLGQDYLFTTDGLFVGALFSDSRFPTESLPASESLLKKGSLNNLSNGSEPFSGWFGKQSDGKIRLTTPMAREAGMIAAIEGLETIRRFAGRPIAITNDQIVKADVSNRARAISKTEPPRYSIKSFPKPPAIDGLTADWGKTPKIPVERPGLPDRATVRLGWDADNLYVLYEVKDSSPWRNSGDSIDRLFKTGDACDLQLETIPKNKTLDKPQAGDVRVLFSPLRESPVAVLMVPVDPSASPSTRRVYSSPVGTQTLSRVEQLREAIARVRTTSDGYVLEAALPLAKLGLSPKSGMQIRGDVGFISSDMTGTMNTNRTYWSNKQTNLVSDEPLESTLAPRQWGEFTFE